MVKKQQKLLNAFFASLIILMLLASIRPIDPSHGWVYPDGSYDSKFETFGPRADKLLIKLYSSDASEFGGLETGQIDVASNSLDDLHYTTYTTPPWNSSIQVTSFGAEYGFYLFDLNNNNNQYLGNPQNPVYPNPVYPNPMSELAMRKAVAYLTNRTAYIAFSGPATSTAMYTPVPPSLGDYVHPDIEPGGSLEDLCYLYSPAAANATLDAGGFPVGLDGWRYWDMNHNSVKDAGEDFTLKIFGRVDDCATNYAGNDIYTNLLASKVHCDIIHVTSDTAEILVMTQKNYHIYTDFKSIDLNPSYLADWNWDFYWHPGVPPNYAGCNDPIFNTLSHSVLHANNQTEAISNAYSAQLRFAGNVLAIPLWCRNGYKATSRTYVGGEASYAGYDWNGLVNVPGFGMDEDWSFMNMHPEVHEYGDGENMIIRYGLNALDINMLNPIYSSTPEEWKILSLIYQSLLKRNASNLSEFIPWLVQKYEVGTYTHPLLGVCSKVKFTLRSDAMWHNGHAITVDDVYYTFVELGRTLRNTGLPLPWWYRNAADILDFKILDPYTFEVLLDTKTIWAIEMIGSIVILPKYVWKPIIETGDPTTNMPDANLTGSGPWLFNELVPSDHILLSSNKERPHETSDVITFRDYMRSSGISIDIAGFPTLKPTPDTTAGISLEIRNHFSNLSVAGILFVDFNQELIDVQDVELPPGSAHNWTYSLYMNSSEGGLHYVTCTFMPTTLPEDTMPDNVRAESIVRLWATIPQDIVGDYFLVPNLPCPDFKVDVKDIATAAKAFGSYPGSLRWNPVADINGDYKIDIKDIAGICSKFGWHLQMIQQAEGIFDMPPVDGKKDKDLDWVGPDGPSDSPTEGDRQPRDRWNPWKQGNDYLLAEQVDSKGNKLQVWSKTGPGWGYYAKFYNAKEGKWYWLGKCPWDDGMNIESKKMKDKNGDIIGVKWVSKTETGKIDGATDFDGNAGTPNGAAGDRVEYEYDVKTNTLTRKWLDKNGNAKGSPPGPITPPETTGGVQGPTDWD